MTAAGRACHRVRNKTVDCLPNTLDVTLGTFAAWNMFFFFTAAMLFINVHHYFIDNVLWRFKDPEVRAYLLS